MEYFTVRFQTLTYKTLRARVQVPGVIDNEEDLLDACARQVQQGAYDIVAEEASFTEVDTETFFDLVQSLNFTVIGLYDTDETYVAQVRALTPAGAAHMAQLECWADNGCDPNMDAEPLTIVAILRGHHTLL